MPDLIEIQKDSYNWFLKEGLAELFDEINPVADFIGRDLELYLEDYYLDEPKFSEVESREKNITYEAPLRVKTRLLNKKTNHAVNQEVFLGDFPLMTDKGTFIINGIERVVVSQLIRSAGGYGQLMAKEKGYVQVKLPSGEVRMILDRCRATVGQLGNLDHENISIGKAGRSRLMGRRPKVRGVVMNPVDHPHGGGEGRTSGGRHPVTPWGVPTKGYKTRKRSKSSDKLIVKRRK